MSVGAKAKAPCGHWGEAVIGQYVACERCDAVPAWVEREITEKICRHLDPYVMDGKVWCWSCGMRLRTL